MARRTSFGSEGDAPAGSTGARAEPQDPGRGFVLALRWVATRDLSSAEIRQRLQRLGFSRDTIDEVVGRLTRERVIDDRRVALSIARVGRDLKRHGPHRVARDLEARGIPRDEARVAVAETFAEADETALLERALARRLHGTIDSPADFRRLYQYLCRQGFASSSIVRTLEAHRKQVRKPGW